MTGQTPTEFLDGLGFWKQKVIAAHATCLTEKDIEVLGRNRIGISHNPESNLKLGTKIAPVKSLREAGAHVGIGTDSVASNNNLDLLQEIDFAAKLQAYVAGPGALSPLQAVRMLTIEGAKALKRDSEIGSLEVGKQADISILNFNQAHLVPMYDPYAHLVYSATGSDVRTVMVAGKVLYDEGKVLTVDESKVISEAIEWAKKISQT
jgi:5-methylthioadenosine/S-adenosylhomocysteine deaminase